ncbi:unnamed protein product [Rotaria sordida]|uniref:Uncharacterized protein n=1 Tax=Rotaria sordida TaxID=392033 RepID=A0A815JGF5_9BILA|nr:unnamed protein product [Rotaria sordida]CAF4055315.1 unnamed protein product [Rotaria sordida]
MSKSELNISNVSPSTYQHACMTFSMNDRLRLVRFPLTIINVIQKIINTTWLQGLQKEKQDENYYEFKFNGNPWSSRESDNISSRIMILHILSALYSHGWSLVTSNDFCRLTEDRNSFIFQLDPFPLTTSFFAISRYGVDKLRLICVSSEIIQTIKSIFGQNNIQREEWLDNEQTCYQLKIRGNPWSGNETNFTRIRVLALLDCFTSFNYQLYTGVYLNTIPDTIEADTWIFYRKIQ